MVASDWAGQANQVQYSPCEIQALSQRLAQAIEQQGAGGCGCGKNTQQQCVKTNERALVGGKSRVVYKGPRGGRYIKKGGEFVPLKTASKST